MHACMHAHDDIPDPPPASRIPWLRPLWHYGQMGVFVGCISLAGARVGLRGLTGVDPGGQKVVILGSQGASMGCHYACMHAVLGPLGGPFGPLLDPQMTHFRLVSHRWSGQDDTSGHLLSPF